MNWKNGLVTLLALAAWCVPASATVKVETVKTHKTVKNAYDADAEFPRTGNAAIDEAIADWANKTVNDFIAEAKADHSGENGDLRPYAIGVSFETARNDAQMFAVVFNVYTDTAGAHPNSYFKTFNFQMPDGYQVFLPEIFDGTPALKRISALAIADLDKRLAGPDSMSDKDWIAQGAGPDWTNFEDFVLLPDTLDIQFPSYQVAAYAAGPQETKIPLSKLSGLMRKNWRTPVPSFDCAQAKSDVEKALCSDITLARLDRGVADAYRAKLSFAEGADKMALRNVQRTWLKQRDTACAGNDGKAMVACLAGIYRARLTALTSQD